MTAPTVVFKAAHSCARVVTARKDYRCGLCGSRIGRGDQCVVGIEYPGHDAGYATTAGRPVRWRFCYSRECSPWAMP